MVAKKIARKRASKTAGPTPVVSVSVPEQVPAKRRGRPVTIGKKVAPEVVVKPDVPSASQTVIFGYKRVALSSVTPVMEAVVREYAKSKHIPIATAEGWLAVIRVYLTKNILLQSGRLCRILPMAPTATNLAKVRVDKNLRGFTWNERLAVS